MTKLEKIDINLDFYRIYLHFQNQEDPFVLHFDTPARRFYKLCQKTPPLGAGMNGIL